MKNLVLLLITMLAFVFSRTQASSLSLDEINLVLSHGVGQMDFKRVEMIGEEIRFRQLDSRWEIKRSAGNWIFGQENTLLSYRGLDFLSQFENIGLSELRFRNKDGLKIRFSELEVGSDEKTRVDTLKLACGGDDISDCLQNMTMTARFLTLEGSGKEMATEALAFEATDALDKFERIWINVREGAFHLHFSFKALFRFPVNVKGQVSEGDGFLRLKIDEAKVSVIGVKKRLLKALKERESKSFKVEGDVLYLTTGAAQE